MNLRLNSGNFYLVFGYKKFQTTNTSVVVWFWMNSMLVLEVVWNGEVYEESWYQKGQKSAFLGKTARWYQYLHRVVLVPLNRTHLVPVPRQVVPVPTYRMCLVPVHSGTGITASNSPDFCNFRIIMLKFIHR